ncbi:hypothetical protein [Paenibacillus protaetiae]|uniref:Uncharacterized protein n=1 Tax=Paenibacillus protaetiae TaxID=2509456 RepID=A0A4P6F1J1_9BACL|nr:hypothetical protein [Paenibacillus protaetiae]QAY66907.1 hypothetical protein ET464_11385 [Paenibacillus protaetiae]
MSELQHDEQGTPQEQPKKLSQAERAKQLLAQKKQSKQNDATAKNGSTQTQVLKSQNTKKVNNQRKKMGV